MFDANLRGLPVGMKFFAKVLGCQVGCYLYRHGVRDNDLIQCQMLQSDYEGADMGDVQISFVDQNFTFWEPETEGALLIYEGLVDGTGFIDDDSMAMAMDSLKNNGDDNA